MADRSDVQAPPSCAPLARYFAAQVLPQATALDAAVRGGAAVLFDVDVTDLSRSSARYADRAGWIRLRPAFLAM